MVASINKVALSLLLLTSHALAQQPEEDELPPASARPAMRPRPAPRPRYTADDAPPPLLELPVNMTALRHHAGEQGVQPCRRVGHGPVRAK